MEQKQDELTTEQFAGQLRLLNVDPKFYNKAVSLIELEDKYKELALAAHNSANSFQKWIAAILKQKGDNEVLLSTDEIKDLKKFKVNISAIKNENKDTTHIHIAYETINE